MVCCSHLFQNFQFIVIHTVKGFGIVKAEIDVFLELSCFFDDPADVGNLRSVTLPSLVLCLPQAFGFSALFFSPQYKMWVPPELPLCAEARNSQEAGLTRRLTLFVSHQSGMIVLYCLMLSVLKISFICSTFFCFRWEDKPGSFILPLEVEFLILYVFYCSIHISISSV